MKLNWLWEACFYNDKLEGGDTVFINQPPDDRYSKHDDNAEWNPSAYRDFLDYFNEHKDELQYFKLKKVGSDEYVIVHFEKDGPYICKFNKLPGKEYEYCCEHLEDGVTDAQPIYYREMQNTSVNGVFGEPECIAYVVGFQGKKDGKNYQQVVRIPA